MNGWLVLDSSKREYLQGVLDSLHRLLLSRNLDSYKESTTTRFTSIVNHPTQDKIAAHFPIGSVKEWDESIEVLVSEDDLSELDDSWNVGQEDN